MMDDGVALVDQYRAVFRHPFVDLHIFIGNAFGKLAGSTQVQELGTIESPIILTNTLSVAAAIEEHYKPLGPSDRVPAAGLPPAHTGIDAGPVILQDGELCTEPLRLAENRLDLVDGTYKLLMPPDYGPAAVIVRASQEPLQPSQSSASGARSGSSPSPALRSRSIGSDGSG